MVVFLTRCKNIYFPYIMQIVLLYFLKKIHVFYLFYKIAILRLQNQIITTMDTIEKKERLIHLFNLAQLVGLCHSKKEFAEFLDINENSLYLAMRGDERYLSEKFFAKIENTLTTAGVNINAQNVQQSTDGDNTINITDPSEFLAGLLRYNSVHTFTHTYTH